MRVDLEVAGGVDEKVGGFQVAVQHVGRVNVLEASQDLVEEVAHMVIAQPLSLQQLVEVCLHQSLHDVAGGGTWVKEGFHRATVSKSNIYLDLL